VLDGGLLDSDNECVALTYLSHPSVAPEGRQRLCNGFVKGLRRHLNRVLVAIRVFARNTAALQSHQCIFAF